MPVKGELFDVVTANPPYVISPDTDYLFRDSPGELHELCRGLVRALPEYLNEDGVAHVLCNWATREGETPWQVVGEWTHGLGCDVLVINFGQEDLVSYASRWTEPLAAKAEIDYASAVRRWLEYYREQQLETIWFGVVLLRRARAGRTGSAASAPRTSRPGSRPTTSCGCWRRRTGSPGSLRCRPCSGSGSRSCRTRSSRSSTTTRSRAVTRKRGRACGCWRASAWRRRSRPTRCRSSILLDGTRTLAEAIDEVARARDDISEEALANAARPVVLNLFELGLLERV